MGAARRSHWLREGGAANANSDSPSSARRGALAGAGTGQSRSRVGLATTAQRAQVVRARGVAAALRQQPPAAAEPAHGERRPAPAARPGAFHAGADRSGLLGTAGTTRH